MNKLIFAVLLVFIAFNQISTAAASESNNTANYAIGVWSTRNSLYNVGYIDLNGLNPSISKLVLTNYWFSGGVNLYQMGTYNKQSSTLTLVAQDWAKHDYFLLSIDTIQWNLVSAVPITGRTEYFGLTSVPGSNNFYTAMTNSSVSGFFVQVVNPFTLSASSFDYINSRFYGATFDSLTSNYIVAYKNNSGLFLNIYQDTTLIATKQINFPLPPNQKAFDDPFRLMFSPATGNILGRVTVYDSEQEAYISYIVFFNLYSGSIEYTNMVSNPKDQLTTTVTDLEAPLAYSFGTSDYDSSTYVYQFNTLLGTFVSRTLCSPIPIALFV